MVLTIGGLLQKADTHPQKTGLLQMTLQWPCPEKLTLYRLLATCYTKLKAGTRIFVRANILNG